jgi:glyoxylase-like metal-dependent hydrolase (beta-lactamase superfamily II)
MVRRRHSAEQLYDSLHGKVLKLADHVEVFPAHFADRARRKGISGEPAPQPDR